MKSRIIVAAAAALCFTTSAFAADPTPMAAKPMAAPAKAMAVPAKPMAAKSMVAKPVVAKPVVKRAVGANSATKSGAKPRTAISIDCSKQADAKGLHGKDREKFRESCKKGK